MTLLLTMLGLVLVSNASASGRYRQVTKSDVYEFDPFPVHGDQVPGARGMLMTDENGARLRLHTGSLIPGDAMTVWWVIFANPSACAGYPTEECGLGNLGNPEVAAEITYATGGVVNQNGRIRCQITPIKVLPQFM